ncbi:MAG: AAA family ATPase [Bacteroidota bacterium]
MKKIYVAATGQHVGKTTSTLGLVANLKEMGLHTGYCKPVGQKYLSVNGMIADKDAVLFSEAIGFEMKPEWHSPVIIAKGVTKQYIENPDKFDFDNKVRQAAEVLNEQYDVVVYEGTGHPGVGAVCDISNAKVAKMLGASVVMIVEGGIGRTIDKLMMSTALFREQNVPIMGVIVNKVKPEKIEELKYYLNKKLNVMGIPLLGILPYDASLSFPIMETIKRAVGGNIILNQDRIGNRIEDIVAGSLVDTEEFSTFQNVLLVASIKRLNDAIEKIEHITRVKNLSNSPLSGVIVTGDGRHAKWYDEADLNHPHFQKCKIPVISTKLDTYGSVVKISRIEVKINTKTPWKVKRAVELIKEHLDFKLFLKRLDLTIPSINNNW